ncbi:MAG: sigma-70 family RNA polymerase sigma factor [Planctomycetales bacterium]|nr:sigma-70 family RNA polymerase sigma factor [Planctomycetales bacterium]
MTGPESAAVDPFADADEATLLAALRRGDEAAFESLVRRNGPRMLAVARRFLQQDQDAQDAVQDAFLSAFKSLDRFEGNSSLATWLHRIAVNSALMKLRQRQRKSEKMIDDLLPKFTADGHMARPAENWPVTHDTAVQDRELQRVVRQKIDELPETYRTVLLLRDIEEHSTEETAQLLDITPGAVKTRLHRARMALREALSGHILSGGA